MNFIIQKILIIPVTLKDDSSCPALLIPIYRVGFVRCNSFVSKIKHFLVGLTLIKPGIFYWPQIRTFKLKIVLENQRIKLFAAQSYYMRLFKSSYGLGQWRPSLPESMHVQNCHTSPHRYERKC